MSYQVLARKWRPKSFKEMVGQEHVLRALMNALDRQRLHHAYLFTGTRGVGKTTIARILAKCLNCEQGVSSEPCGVCGACTQIADGRFIDLIEVDAASRTKVEDTRELLENVQYAPTAGRYKVYLIDEVHMLSNSSFNALLKTLEEPPPHVKFLLATTDPQKLPATVLSRCLQFNLKNMSPDRIVGHLEYILGKESVDFDESALWSLSRAADGSMRDALSLTDQAIAYGSGQVRDNDVTMMLGTIDQNAVYRLLLSLSQHNGAQLLSEVAMMAEHATDFGSALQALLSVLHRVAIAQVVPEALDNSYGDKARVIELAAAMTVEDVQLFYQLGLNAGKDLAMAPDSRCGFEMILLRMLAFKPVGIPQLPTQTLAQSPPSADVIPAPASAPASAPSPAAAAMPAIPVTAGEEGKKSEPAVAEVAYDDTPPWDSDGPDVEAVRQTAQNSVAAAVTPQHKSHSSSRRSTSALKAMMVDIDRPTTQTSEPAIETVTPEQSPVPQAAPSHSVAELLARSTPEPAIDSMPQASTGTMVAVEDRLALTQQNWPQLYRQLPLNRVVQNIASNCVLLSFADSKAQFVLDESQSTLFNTSHNQKLADQLSAYLQHTVEVVISPGTLPTESPAQIRQRVAAEQLVVAVDLINADPNIEMLIHQFNAVIVPDSVRPVLEAQ